MGILAKRVLDFLLAAAAAITLAPLAAFAAAGVAVTMGRPVLFRQARVGRKGVLFNLYKFRTMTVARDPAGRLLPDNARLTTVGRLLRCTSLDELPQLWNVLRGEMSLVGPRPLLPEYLPRYTERQNLRHRVLPGITGWAQVNGRNAIGWRERLEMDAWYAEHWSLTLDARILARTLGAVFLRRGISAEGHATMPSFLEQSEANQS